MANNTEVGSNYENCTSRSLPGANVASPIAMSLVGIVGNAIAIMTLHRTKLERHRTVFFVFVAGLAWADLIGIILTTFPVLLAYSNGSLVNGGRLCNYHAFAMITFGLLTPMIVCAMAIERYIGIRHGYFYMRHFSPLRAKISLLILWLAAILFSALPLFGFGQYALQYPCTWCFLNIHPDIPINTAYSITFAALNLLLIGTMIVCNIVVQCTLVVLRCKRGTMDHPDRFRRTHRSQQQQELEVQMMIVLFAITLVFTLCWAPLQIVIITNLFVEHRTAEDHAGDLLAVRLASINQLLDPWVYILCKKICFRIPCTWWKCFIPDKLGSTKRSQRELLATSSLRLAFQNRLVHSNEENVLPYLVPQETAEPMKTSDENKDFPTNHSVDSGTSSYNNVSNSVSNPINEGTARHRVPFESYDSPEVPIPIFTSSHYVIRQSNRSVTSHGPRAPRRTSFLSNSARGRRGVLPQAKMLSMPADIASKTPAIYQYHQRSYSWTCTDAKSFSKKQYVTKSTQTASET